MAEEDLRDNNTWESGGRARRYSQGHSGLLSEGILCLDGGEEQNQLVLARQQRESSTVLTFNGERLHVA